MSHPERKRAQERARLYSPRFAIPDAELIRPLQEMITPIASIPESERLAYFTGWERLARMPEDKTSFYHVPFLCGKAIGIAQQVWKVWPPQEED